MHVLKDLFTINPEVYELLYSKIQQQKDRTKSYITINETMVESLCITKSLNVQIRTRCIEYGRPDRRAAYEYFKGTWFSEEENFTFSKHFVFSGNKGTFYVNLLDIGISLFLLLIDNKISSKALKDVYIILDQIITGTKPSLINLNKNYSGLLGEVSVKRIRPPDLLEFLEILHNDNHCEYTETRVSTSEIMFEISDLINKYKEV